jgi:hypothetical protein
MKRKGLLLAVIVSLPAFADESQFAAADDEPQFEIVDEPEVEVDRPLERGRSRLIGTGGLLQVEGAGGGGLVPWATMSGYADTDQWNLSAAVSHVNVDDFSLDVGALAASWNNRVEVSLARQRFDLQDLGAALGRPGQNLEQDVLGLKFRVLGDFVYGDAPQVSLGVQYKRNRHGGLVQSLGARDDSGIDLYASVSRVFLAGVGDRNAFANATVRLTRANQLGLVGFGGAVGNDYEPMLELSAGVFLSPRIALGAEYRQKPDNLAGIREDDWVDVFVAMYPNKHVSLVAAWVDLGDIAGQGDQQGAYLSVNIGL